MAKVTHTVFDLSDINVRLQCSRCENEIVVSIEKKNDDVEVPLDCPMCTHSWRYADNHRRGVMESIIGNLRRTAKEEKDNNLPVKLKFETTTPSIDAKLG